MVVFTAAARDYADFVCKLIDPQGLFFEHKFYRNSCKNLGFFLVKDLKIVVNKIKQSHPYVFSGCSDPLSKVVIIDNMHQSF